MQPLHNKFSVQQHQSARADLVIPKSLSLEQRKLGVSLLATGLFTDQTIMDQLGIKKTCFYKYKPWWKRGILYLPNDQYYRVTGRVRHNTMHIIDSRSVHDQFLMYNIVTDPLLTLQKQQAEFAAHLGLYVSLSTMYRWRIDNNLSYKAICRGAYEATGTQCINFVTLLRAVCTNVNQLVWYDESHFNRKVYNKGRGWSLKLGLGSVNLRLTHA